jgi:hypothetical protein
MQIARYPFLAAAALMAVAGSGVLRADSPIDRWAAAVGGRQKIEPIRALYREATIDVAGFTGTIRAWHTADGHYRKEEQVADYSTVETFDGATGVVRQAGAPPRAFTGADLERTRSTAFANWAAVFFAFFPERLKGTRTVDTDGAIVLHVDGGIDWRVTLDPATSLPKVMTHSEGQRTVTVTFEKYETIDGLTFEQEIHRSNGNPMYNAVIRFTKTVVNPDIDPSLFRQAQ